MARKKKAAFGSEEERAAHDARVDEDISRLRGLLEKAQAEIDAKKLAQRNASAQGGGTAP